MTTAGSYKKLIVMDIENESGGIIDTAAISGTVLKPFGFAQTFGAVSFYILDEGVYFFEGLLILCLPVKIIVPGFIDQSLFIQWFLNQFVLSTTVGTKLIEGSVQGT